MRQGEETENKIMNDKLKPSYEQLEKELTASKLHNERLVEVLRNIIGDGFHCGACNSVELAEKALLL